MTQFKNYDIVTPGELLAEGGIGGEGTYMEQEKVFSKYFGMVSMNGNIINIRPLSGKYVPEEGDDIIGKIVEVSDKYWTVNIDVPYSTRIDIRDVGFRVAPGDLASIMDVDDLVYAKIERVTTNRTVDLGMRTPRYTKLPSKMIAKIDPTKIPRLIGKEGSMINTIKDATKCDIIVGQNGIIWVNGPKEQVDLALMAINLVNDKYYDPDLVNRVKELLHYV